MESDLPHITIKYRIVEASYVISAPNLALCPESDYPELAIAGRSNVGKSSLINWMCNQRNLAKTSSTPGKTRLINYFHLRIKPGNLHFHLVDLPGYGYSKVSQNQRVEWQKSLHEFLENRELVGILSLMDARHEPSRQDHQMREWIVHKKIPSITVFTKADKLKQNEFRKAEKKYRSLLKLKDSEPSVLTSTTKNIGLDSLMTYMVSMF